VVHLGGPAVYFGGTRTFSAPSRTAWTGPLQLVATAATVCLALLDRVLIAPAVVAVAAGWAVGAAVLVTVLRRPAMRRLSDDPLAFLDR
jgi:hypothetical protein